MRVYMCVRSCVRSCAVASADDSITGKHNTVFVPFRRRWSSVSVSGRATEPARATLYVTLFVTVLVTLFVSVFVSSRLT